MAGPSYPPPPHHPGGGQYPPSPPPSGYPGQPPHAYRVRGEPLHGYGMAGYAVPQQQEGWLGVASLALGVLSLPLLFLPHWVVAVAWVSAILAVISGAAGISGASRHPGSSKGMSVAGFVLGLITIAFAILGALGH